MWDNIIVTILILELFLIGYLVYLCLKKQRRVIQTIAYFGLIFVINFVVYLIALINEVPDKTMFDVLMCGLNALKTFIFDADVLDYNISFAKEYPLYFAIYGLGVFMGAAMTLFTAVDTFKNFFINKIKLHQRIFSNADILIGNLEMCKKYAKNSDNSILWIDSICDKEELNSLIDDGYVIINKEFNVKNIALILNDNKKYNFIYFNENSKKTVEVISVIEDYVEKYPSNNMHFYLEIEENESAILKELLLGEKIKSYVTTFSKEELLIRKFVEENPLTKHLPTGFINSDTTFNKDKKINVLMIGFDKINLELTKQLILNNQFVTIVDNKYVNKQVNYHLFDFKEAFECDLIKGLERKYRELEKNKKEYFELPENIANFYLNDVDTNSYELLDLISNILSDTDSYNYIFISNSRCNNYEFISKINDEINYDNVHFYLNIDDVVSKKDNISLYGLSDEIINHEVIVDEKLNELAISVNAKYSSLSKEEYYSNWNNLSEFNKKSNIYAALNLRFKLNLLGLDYETGTYNDNLVKEVLGDISLDNEFSFYSKKNIYTALIAEEHARWNAFHLICGYRPMKKKDIIINADNKVLKNVSKKEHACLTTYDGLSDLAQYELNESLNFNLDAKIEEFDVYKYDLLLISLVNSILNELGYKIVKK